MKIRFEVEGLPPKKDGANSMWRKGAQQNRLKALRVEAANRMAASPPTTSAIKMTLCVYAHPGKGDLDNFITGICDGLMAAHHLTPIDLSLWMDIPESARPNHSICFQDGMVINQITATRLPLKETGECYFVELEW